MPLDEQRGVLFSTLHRHLLIVSGELWRALTQLVGVQQEHESIETVATNDELKLLEDLHFIISVDQNEKLFARYLINMAKFNTSVMCLFISFTSRCNFKCSYCYQDFRMSHPAQDLSLQKWQILFSFIRRRVLEFRISDLSIALFGGEPLLNLEVVGRACEDLKITNGALLTPPVWKELAPHVDIVQVTLDGSKEIHDKYRPFSNGRGSYDVIMENIAALGQEAYNKITLRVNVQPETLQGVRELVESIAMSEFRHVFRAIDFEEVFPSQKEVCAGTCGTARVSLLGDRFGELFLMAAALGLPLTRKFEYAPCIHSLANSFAVDEELRVYKCPGLLYWQPVGMVRKDSSIELASEWYEAVAYEPPCALNCVYGPLCYGGCRALAGGSGRIHCRRPYLDKVFGSLVKAYVLAKHAQKLHE